MRDALGAVADAANQVQSPFQKSIDKVLSYQELTDVRIKQLDKPLRKSICFSHPALFSSVVISESEAKC